MELICGGLHRGITYRNNYHMYFLPTTMIGRGCSELGDGTTSRDIGVGATVRWLENFKKTLIRQSSPRLTLDLVWWISKNINQEGGQHQLPKSESQRATHSYCMRLGGRPQRKKRKKRKLKVKGRETVFIPLAWPPFLGYAEQSGSWLMIMIGDAVSLEASRMFY